MKLRSIQVRTFCVFLALTLSVVLAACTLPPLGPQSVPTPTSPTSPPTTDDLSVVLRIQEPIVVHQAVPVLITVMSMKAVPDAYVNLYVYGPGNPQGTRDSQKVALQANQPLHFTKEVTFTRQGFYHLIATIALPAGLSVGDSEWVEITAQGGAVHPVSTDGPEPVPAIRAFTPTPDGTATPLPDSGRVDPSVAINSPDGLVTLHGSVEYEARNGLTLQAKNVRVEVWDVVNGGRDRLMGVTSTDASGAWVLSNVPNYDESGPLDIYYVFYSKSRESLPLQSVQREDGTVYAWTMIDWVRWDVPDGDVYLTGARVDQTVAALPAMWLLSDAYRAREFVQSQSGGHPIDVAIIWEKDKEVRGILQQSVLCPPSVSKRLRARFQS